MLTVAYGNDEATKQILLYSYIMAGLIVLYAIAPFSGVVFAVPGLLLTGGWLWFAHALRRSRDIAAAMRLFHYSTGYLAIVFVAAAVDAIRM
jgi:protoheme IX farnesyltransferase